MNLEEKWMNEILEPFFSETQKGLPTCLAEPNTSNIAVRYQTLTSGYGIRTFNVLSKNFPRFSKSIGESRWHFLGKNFSLNTAPQEPQLGLLPLLFYKYCKKLNLPAKEILALKKDWANFITKQKKYRKDLAVDQINTLSSDPKLLLQESLILIEPENIVISRDHQQTFEALVDKKTSLLLKNLIGKSFQLTELTDKFSDETDLAQFINNSISHRWLYREISPRS